MASAIFNVAKVAVASAAVFISVSLQGCGSKSSEPQAFTVPAAEGWTKESCTEHCERGAMVSRWSNEKYGFLCTDPELGQVNCRCSPSEAEAPEGCRAPGASSFTALSESPVVTPHTARVGGDGQVVLEVGDDASAVELADAAGGGVVARAALGGSPRETVNKFCDVAGLQRMHGSTASGELGSPDAARELETKILADISKELETNNVDKMAKEIFSFYVCTRWAPDSVFWELAKSEMAAQIASVVLDSSDTNSEGNTDYAIASMYRNYKFVPMLCSKNLEVFRETDDEDHTYFRKFKKATLEMSGWLSQAGGSPVGKALTEVDSVFCGGDAMVSCAPGWFDSLFGDTAETRTQTIAKKLRDFATGHANEPGFQADMSAWKERLPFHSFIAKPAGWEADKANSPKAADRFVVCFGKRIASELHRRPNGQHIMTDQNNIGCHGWYTAEKAADQLKRMVELWKPPTCQLATMTYTMKKDIMQKFQEMNERLFDSLPSIINDEMEAKNSDGDWNWEDKLPKPFDRKELTIGDTKFIEGMRVRLLKKLCQPKGATQPTLIPYGNSTDACGDKRIPEGAYGHVKIVEGALRVEWDDKGEYLTEAQYLKIMPHGWLSRKGFHGHVRDLVAGVSKIANKAQEFFNSMFAQKQMNLADLMSGSVSKWAVCPIMEGVDLVDLDNNLGVEDEAFKDFQQNAYKKWTGFQNEIPGEKCIDPAGVLGNRLQGFEGTKVCEINELHADHVEKYTRDDGKLEEFICPLRPALPASEQLEILAEKKGTCFLRMTGSQERQYSWHYQGKFPARRQNDRKDNVPSTEYELVLLTKIPGGGIEEEASFGRFCSLQEFNTQPRFCNLPTIHNEWGTLAEFAQDLIGGVTGVPNSVGEVIAPLGVGSTAITMAVAGYQAKLQQKQSAGDQIQEGAKKAAVWLSEKSWDNLRGAGRLALSTAVHMKDLALDRVPGAGRMLTELEERLFGQEENGELLHALSFQRSIGSSGRTSNSKERFQRYVVSHPCPDFDPAKEFALKKKWSNIAVRLVKEAYHMHGHKTSGVLDKSEMKLAVRGDASHYIEQKDQTVDKTYFPHVSMVWDGATKGSTADFKCTWNGQECLPKRWCSERIASGVLNFFGAERCVERDALWWRSVEAGSWWPVESDPVLKTTFASVVSDARAIPNLYGLEMELFCAPKSAFGKSGPPSSPKPTSLRACMEQGLLTNAALKAREPWKLYFPEEVIVVARFQKLDDRKCMVSKANPQSRAELCAGATEDASAYPHLLDSKGTPLKNLNGKAKFIGIRSGAGHPKATLEEVVLAPQDVLEAVGLLVSSHGR